LKQIKLIIVSIVIFALLSVITTNSAYAVEQKAVDAKKVADAQKKADKIISDAQKKADKIISDAQHIIAWL